MKSRLFHSKDYLAVQDHARDLINSSPDFLSKTTAQSPRAAGDITENVVAACFDTILGNPVRVFVNRLLIRYGVEGM